MVSILVCPICKTPLTQKDGNLYCGNCKLSCTINNDIYDFLGDNNLYWGEISPGEMGKTLNIANSEGWKAAVREVGFKYPGMSEHILSSARVDWLFHCLDLSKTSSCLDLGSDWGTNAFSLARYYDEVWSLDSVSQKIEFQRIRQNQDKIKNIKFVRANWHQLPFPENYFDLISANGVLDRVGLSDHSKNPREIQLDFLKEIRQILKPTGCLYIGIENRFGLPCLLGTKDQSGLPFMNILPKRIADMLIKNKFKRDAWIKETFKDYHAYTYSFYGYKKILEEAGFNKVELYWTLNYNKPKFAGRFDGESFSYFLNLRKKDKIRLTPFSSLPILLGTHLPYSIIKLALTLFSPSFLIFAYKDHKNTSFESKLLQLKSSTSSFIRRSGSLGVNSKVNYFLLKDGKPHSTLKFPRFKESTSLVLEEEKMGRFNQLEIKREEIDSVMVFVEPFIKGKTFQLYNFSHNQAVLKWLLDFQNKTKKGFWDFNQLEAKVAILNNSLSEIPINNELRLRTNGRLELFLESLRNVKLPKNSEHGDFTSINMLFGDDNQLYVTDWEFYKEEGEPLFDFILFILGCATIGGFPQSFRDSFYGQGKYAPILKGLISEFAKAKEIPSKLVLQAVPYIILRCINRTVFMADNKHLSTAHYITLLELWDKMCSSTTSNAQLIS